MDKPGKQMGIQEAAQHEVAALRRQLNTEHAIRRDAHDLLDQAGVRHGPIDARVANVIAKMNEYRQRLADGVDADARKETDPYSIQSFPSLTPEQHRDLEEAHKRAEYVARIERELRPASFSDEQWSCAWEYAHDITSDEDGDSSLPDVEKVLSCFVSLVRRLGYVPYDPPNFIE